MVKYYKLLHFDMIHHGFKYSPGLNTDPIEFNGNPFVTIGHGLYFSELDHIFKHIDTGHRWLAEIAIPEGEAVINGPDMSYRAHRIIITHMHDLFDIRTWRLIRRNLHIKDYSDTLINWLVNPSFCDPNVDIIKYAIHVMRKSSNMGNPICDEAAKIGNLSIVKELIENGYSSVKTNHALQYAALYNQNDIIKYLVDKGADIDACNGYALNEVTQSGNIEMVKYLVEHGADPWKSHDGYLPIAVVISMISGGCYGGMSKKSYKEIIEYFDSIRSDGYRIIHEKNDLKETHMYETKNGIKDEEIGSSSVKCLVKEDIETRMNHRIPADLFRTLGIKSPVRIAGSSCNSDIPNDIDVYPSVENQFGHSFREEIIKKNCSGIRILNDSSNALTVRCDEYPYPVQFCSYMNKSLYGLVESFDFSHVQVGIEVSYSDGEYIISDVQFTNVYVNYLLTRKSMYTGSEYPLSSLIRTLKYYKRGYLDKFSSKLAIISILTSILDRGFSDYEDFKDQLNSIDLYLLEDDDSGELRDAALDLYNRLHKKA